MCKLTCDVLQVFQFNDFCFGTTKRNKQKPLGLTDKGQECLGPSRLYSPYTTSLIKLCFL